MLCLSGFELYSRWVPLKEYNLVIAAVRRLLLPISANSRRTTLFRSESSRVTAISKMVDYWPQRLDRHKVRCTVICRHYLMCCELNWNTRWKWNFRNTASAEGIQQKWTTANEWTTHLHCFGAKLLTAKEILLTGNYYLVLLKKQRWNKSWTENARRRFKLKQIRARRTWDS